MPEYFEPFFELAEDQRVATSAELEIIARNASLSFGQQEKNPCQTCQFRRHDDEGEYCLVCSVYLGIEGFAPDKCEHAAEEAGLRWDVQAENPHLSGFELDEKVADERDKRMRRS